MHASEVVTACMPPHNAEHDSPIRMRRLMNGPALGQTWFTPVVLERMVPRPDGDTRPGVQQSDGEFDRVANLLKAMGHPLRLRILCLLGSGDEISVQDLVERVGTSQSNISQHLSLLREAGVLRTRRDATRVYYRIAAKELAVVLRWLEQGIAGGRPSSGRRAAPVRA